MKNLFALPMNRTRRKALALLAGLAAGAPARPALALAPQQEPAMKIRLIVAGQIASATLYDNATARDFASLLPLSLTMTDYDTIERVADLPRKLSTQGAPEGMAPMVGELTHYAPWGNLAIFIQPRAYARSLLPLGRIDEGLAIVSRPGPYEMRIEPIEP
ncbi:putative exported protein [Bordetella bronchiseptica MO149]|uniref:cyclophilin-like fold protein n=1 Tax=Bordetella bronchiseptica TaxID=518 RepID=UPI00028B523B|nr:cyclophilin-like fold protein [Bordetella bronchiseptica]KCV36059.1 hypothetical protein L489_2525 [Bordetella bronchiseptica 00-P-2730]AZW31400.1 hypothetical protein CS343_14625 [Bordetella bronchiseptica]KCV39221.1 hypothetical protein L572_2449 [Bordetella bronchiseptica 345]KDC42254.1 hypothetical protein L506_2421 [Bordetella bronchiseptica GA96-01]CCJ59520.1 putative exported protein [Bordetella bronchiseptica MO149]